MINIASIEQQLSQHGHFCLLEWIVSDNLLAYADYEAWRYGKHAHLDQLIQLGSNDIDDLLSEVERHCQGLGLAAQPHDFFSWQPDQRVPLKACTHPLKSEQVTQYWRRAEDQPQLDLFMDNSLQIAQNDLLESLQARQFDAAQNALHKVTELDAEGDDIGAFQDLINYGQHLTANPKVPVADLAQEWQGLTQEVQSLAQETLGSSARDYLAFAWRRLAMSMQGLKFDPNQPERHASAALLNIPDYTSLAQCLNEQPDLYQHPVLLERLAQSYFAQHRLDSALIIWCFCFELDSTYAETAIDRYPHQPVHTLWQDFKAIEPECPDSDFTAFVLIKQPRLVPSLNHYPFFRQGINQAAVELLQHPINGPEAMTLRRTLQNHSPRLLAIYLNGV